MDNVYDSLGFRLAAKVKIKKKQEESSEVNYSA